MDKKKRIGLKILIIVVIVGAIIGALVNFITDFMWFSEMGYVSVFLTKLFTMLKIGIPVFIVVTFLAYIYLKVIKMGYFKRIVSSEVTDEKKLNLISWGLAGAFGLITTYISTTRLWFEVLQFFNSTDFNKEDPLFNNDISFYVLKLGFINGLSGILLGVLVVFLLLTAIYYGILISMHTPDFMKGGNKEPEQEYQEGLAEFEKQKAEVMEQLLIRRLGTVEDIAKLAAFLASDGASYITGQVIAVDGGMVL